MNQAIPPGRFYGVCLVEAVKGADLFRGCPAVAGPQPAKAAAAEWRKLAEARGGVFGRSGPVWPVAASFVEMGRGEGAGHWQTQRPTIGEKTSAPEKKVRAGKKVRGPVGGRSDVPVGRPCM